MTKSLSLISLACGLCLAGCGNPPWDNPVSQYVQRNPGVTLSAGNAHDVNAVTHMNDPWPRYVQNRKIDGNGERMANAVARYRQQKQAPPPIAPIFGSTIGISGGTGS